MTWVVEDIWYGLSRSGGIIPLSSWKDEKGKRTFMFGMLFQFNNAKGKKWIHCLMLYEIKEENEAFVLNPPILDMKIWQEKEVVK